MKDLDRAVQLLKDDGIRAVYHAALMKLKELDKEQTKYDKWIQRFEYQMPIEKADSNSAFSIALICVDNDMFKAIENEEADYFAFYYKGDSVNKDWKAIIAAYLERHKNVRFVYTDEDFMSEGIRRNPVFKPEWSPDTYMSYDYIGGLMVIERNLVLKAKDVLSAYGDLIERYKNGCLYALGLCAAEMLGEDQIGHIKRVLYHRKSKHNIEKEALMNIKTDLIERRGLKAFAEFEARTGEVRVVYEANESIKVSLIVPSKDQAEILETCMESVNLYTDYDNYEWVVVDNGSNKEQREKYEALAEKTTHPYKYIYDKKDFNFAAMCNTGVANADGQCYVFLNDDIEFMDNCPQWLGRIVSQAMQKHTGVVGAKLLYPKTTLIQHIGVVNYARGASHILNQADDKKILPLNRNCLDVNVSIATGALLAVESKKFHEAGGFCEDLKVTYNDVELCLSLLEKGYYNIVRSDVVAYHHESLARGEDALDMKKYRRCLKEREKLFELHPDFIGVDKYYHPYLTQTALNAGITTHYLPLAGKPKRVHNMPIRVGNNSIKYRVDGIESDEWTRVRGYAYMDNPGKEKISLILLGERGYRFDTTPVFNHTYTQLINDGKSYAFIGFECVLRHLELPDDEYKIFIKIGKYMVETDRVILVNHN